MYVAIFMIFDRHNARLELLNVGYTFEGVGLHALARQINDWSEPAYVVGVRTRPNWKATTDVRWEFAAAIMG